MDEPVTRRAGTESSTQSNLPSTSTSAPLYTAEDVERIAQAVARKALEEFQRASVAATTVPDERTARRVAVALAVEEEERKQADRQRQRELVRTSRASVSNLANEVVNLTFNQQAHYGSSTPYTTPLRPRPPQQTKAAINRRLSDGYAEPPASTTAEAAAAAAAVGGAGSIEVEMMDTELYRRYESTNRTLSKSVEKFTGERQSEDDRTVEEFVDLINTEMDVWLGEVQQHGRLNLVIGRTGGMAQNWLVRKRQEMKKLHAAGEVTDRLLMEWCEVQDDFKVEMSKGITNAVYEQQLKALRIRDKDGRMDVAKFRRRFDQICTRLYPSSQFTSESDRRRRLGEKFEERLRYCGEGPKLRDECLKMLIARRISEKERMVEDWQDVLLEVASTDEWIHPKAVPAGKDKRQTSWPARQPTVSAMAVSAEEEDGSQSDEGTARAEGVQAAAVSTGSASGKSKFFNRHLSPEMVTQLRALKQTCLSCYKTGHYSNKCPKPANRPPTAAELKGEAEQWTFRNGRPLEPISDGWRTNKR